MEGESGPFVEFWQKSRDPSGEIYALVDMTGFGDEFWYVTYEISNYIDNSGITWELLLGVTIELINEMAYLAYYTLWVKRPNTIQRFQERRD